MSALENILIEVGDLGHMLRAIDDHIFNMGQIEDEEMRGNIHRLSALVRCATVLSDRATPVFRRCPQPFSATVEMTFL